MSIFRVTRDDIENFTIVTNPERSFASSSNGVTGSLRLFARRSQSEKETRPLSLFDETKFGDDVDINDILERAKASAAASGNNFAAMQQYLSGVNAIGESQRLAQQLSITRFVPSFDFTNNTISKTQITDVLMPHYRHVYPESHFTYTNYHCLNFFTASSVPSDTAILYPNVNSGSGPSEPYTPQGAFTFDFHINPKYTTDDRDSGFKAGTILHLSGAYAISLVTGSSKDAEGKPDGYRILLQLSESAGIAPSLALPGAGQPNDLIFMSDDNSLKRNHWHHVVIRWGTNSRNLGTGSFIIDSEAAGNFVVPSASIAPSSADPDPSVLVVGNFYEGTNSGVNSADRFFSYDPARRDGLKILNGSSGIETPTAFTFDHPLNAEVHDLKFYDSFRLDSKLTGNAPSVNDPELRFYVPPFFTKESPVRRNVGTFGGVLQTPFFSIDGYTDDPFNAALSFGVGGHYLNNENFGRDMVNGNYPRWLHLTASQIVGDAQEALSANAYLYATASNRKRNVTILPCDNGLFVPNFNWLMTGSNQSQPQKPASGSIMDKYRNDLGTLDLSAILLRDLIPEDQLFKSVTEQSGSIFNQIAGATPENPGVDPGEVLTIFQRTRDNSSNEVVMFDMSNMFYGERINPGSFTIKDTDISGTDGKVQVTIKDNGLGSMYRADALTKHATWNSIGNIFYSEGIMLIKTPNVPFFGQDQWETTFEGEHCVHTLKFDVVAPNGMVDSSSNPSYQEISASFNANDKDGKFVYVTNILFLDDNLNVVMKTNLSQPIVKRRGDKITFRPKIDF